MKPRVSKSLAVALLGSGLLLGHLQAAEKKAPDLVDQKIRLLGQALSERDLGNPELALQKLEALIALGVNDPQVIRLKAQLRELIDHPPPPPRKPEVTLHTEFSLTPSPELAPASVRTEVISSQAAKAAASGTSAREAQSASQANDTARHGLPASPVVTRFAGPVAPDPHVEEDVYGPLRHGSVNVDTLVSLEFARQQRLLEAAERQLRYVRQLEIEGRYTEAFAAVRFVCSELPVNPLTQPFRDRVDAIRVNLEHRVRVAALSPGVDAPRMSLVQEEPQQGAMRIELDLQFLELPGDIAEDLRKAWRMYYDSEYNRGPSSALYGRTGRELFHRPSGTLPSRRQLALVGALRKGALRLSQAGVPFFRAGMVGQVVLMDPSELVRVLSGMTECVMLGAPRWTAASGQLNTLVFSPEQANSSSSPSNGEKVGWQMTLTPTVQTGAEWIDLDLHPKVTRYEGYVPNGPSSNTLQAGYSSHELSTRVSVPNGSTLLVFGPVWTDEAERSDHFTRRLPVLGPYLVLRDTAKAQTTLLTLVTVRPAIR